MTRVSVCVATFNGSKYILGQLASILNQLDRDDEVVVCDDGSTDDTVCLIKSLNDPRVQIYINDVNIGHVKNFERAISIARNDIIFLSDQDDVWEAGKVSLIKSLFAKDESVCVIHHGMVRIDSNGVLLPGVGRVSPFFSRHVLISQFWKSFVFGCCLAFRRDFRREIIPFPNIVYAHDHWIALAAGSKNGFLNIADALIRYRMHENNLTPKGSLPVLRRIQLRVVQLILLLEIFRRRLFNG